MRLSDHCVRLQVLNPLNYNSPKQATKASWLHLSGRTAPWAGVALLAVGFAA